MPATGYKALSLHYWLPPTTTEVGFAQSKMLPLRSLILRETPTNFIPLSKRWKTPVPPSFSCPTFEKLLMELLRVEPTPGPPTGGLQKVEESPSPYLCFLRMYWELPVSVFHSDLNPPAGK